jgi:hypothetical protein
MTVARLMKDAEDLKKWFSGKILSSQDARVAAKVAAQVAAPAATKEEEDAAAKSIGDILESFGIKKNNIVAFFNRHCDDQLWALDKITLAVTKSLSELESARTDAINYGDVVLFLTGSLAKLEFIKGVSDIDIVAITTSMDLPEKCADATCEMKSVSRFKKKLEVLEQALKKQVKPIKLDISGRPFYDGRYFYGKKELFEQLGEFNEPSWAASHRHSMLFESAVCPGTRQINIGRNREKCPEEDFAEEMRLEINDKYFINQDLIESEYPMLGAFLITALTNGAAIAQLSKLKNPPQKKDKKGGLKMQEILLAEKEISKTVGGRIWNAAAHLITLHLLFWTRRLLTNKQCDDLFFKNDIFRNISHKTMDKTIQNMLYGSPMKKMLLYCPAMTRALCGCLERLDQSRESRVRQISDENVQTEVVELVRAVRDFIGPLGSGIPGSHTKGMAMPMFQLYIYLFMTLKKVREGKRGFKQLNSSDVNRISVINSQLYACLRKCEELTRLLITKTSETNTGHLQYFRIFGPGGLNA